MKFACIFSVSILLLVSCKKEAPPEVGKVAFQYEYVNFAWGYQRISWFIDTNGVVNLFQSQDHFDTWISPGEDGYITEDDFQHNYQLADTVIYRLDTNEVRGKVPMISLVNLNDLTTIECTAADAGNHTLYCYTWDNNARRYRRLLLATVGDFTQTNNNSYAKALTAWLIDKGGNEIKYFDWW